MKRWGGLRGRLLITYLLVIVVGMGVFVLRYGWVNQDAQVRDTQREAEVRAFIVANAVQSVIESYREGETSYQTLSSLADRLATSVNSRLTILDNRGIPFYDSQFDAGQIENQWQKPEVQAALVNKQQYDIRVDPASQQEYFYTAAPVVHDGNLEAIVQLALPTTALWAGVRQTWLSLLGTAGLVILITILVSVWLANTILEPVGKLRQAAAQIASGNLEQRIALGRRDELADLAQAFNTMAARLQYLMQQQRDFVANASHELRTPLTTIRLRVESLLGGARQNPEVANQFLAEIESEVDRLSKLVDNLLILSRVEAGIDNLTFAPVDMTLLIRETLDSFVPRAEAAGSRLTVDMRPDLPPVRAVASQIRQVMDNLLENALKYSHSASAINLSCRRSGDHLTVSITDTGHGISSADLPHVFERFYRADKSRSRSSGQGGTGLGLSIARSVITAHGGHISIDSQEGKGTTVRFTLPLYDPNTPSGATSAGH